MDIPLFLEQHFYGVIGTLVVLAVLSFAFVLTFSSRFIMDWFIKNLRG